MRSLAPLGGARVFLTEADPGTGPLVGNVSLGVGDDPEAVHARRRYLSTRLGAPIVWMDQTHSSDVAVVGLGEMGPIMRADGVYAPLDSRCEGEYGPVPADGVVIERALVGDYVTSLEMPGVSVTLTRVDDELLGLFDAPARTPAWK